MVTREARKPLKTLPGGNGTLELYPDRVIIRRKKALERLSRGGCSEDCWALHFDDIREVYYYPGRVHFLGSGCIQFHVKSGEDRPLLLIYDRKHDALARQIVDYIEAHITGTEPGEA